MDKSTFEKRMTPKEKIFKNFSGIYSMWNKYILCEIKNLKPTTAPGLVYSVNFR